MHEKVLKNHKSLKQLLKKELDFINGVFSSLSVPQRMIDGNDDIDDYVYVNESREDPKEAITNNRARSMEELKNRLDKLKSEKNLSIKKKLMKKSLNSKNKKLSRKAERNLKAKLSKTNGSIVEKVTIKKEKKEEDTKENVIKSKPVFNTDGKLVFSKFDFSGVGKKSKKSKEERDPNKLLDNLKQQEQSVKKLMEAGNVEAAEEVKSKIAWKNVLAKAEGKKVKDDPLLLKKTAKKLDNKKKQSKKKWDERIKNVETGKEERQKKRQENISKKKKEKKSAKVKKSIKKGRVVVQ